jgi:hypothetical protein
MSGTSTLISCTGKINREELANLPTPPATEPHVPIPHTAVLETLVEILSHRHIGVVGGEFAVSSDGMEMFGVLDLETGFEGADLRSGFGMLTTNDSGSHTQLAFGYLFVTILRFVATYPGLSKPLEAFLARGRSLDRY